MLMSIRTTSGSSAGELDRLRAVARVPDHLDPVVVGEDRLERLREEPVVVGDQDADRAAARSSAASNRGSREVGFEVRTREQIQKLLVTGDNRLKQGVDARRCGRATSRLLVATRPGSRIDPAVVEIRLADLERLARGSPRPAPPAR